MTYNLVFLKFRNYYNRRIKRYNTLEEYTNKNDYFMEDITRNINYNDGINMSIIVNRNSALNSLGYNYIIALDSSTGKIDSRWFILEERQTRQGQWSYSLRRDLIADFYDEFMHSTIYLQKGWVKSINNNLIFNDELFSANQIKQSEELIKDNIGCKWLVGYVAKPESYKEGSTEKYGDFWKGKTFVTDSNAALAADITINTSFAEWDLYKYTQSIHNHISELTFNFDYSGYTSSIGSRVFIDSYGAAVNPNDNTKYGQYQIPINDIQGHIRNNSFVDTQQFVNNYKLYYKFIYDKYCEANNYVTTEIWQDLYKTFASSKLVYSTVDGTYRRVYIAWSSPKRYTEQYSVDPTEQPSLYNDCVSVFNNIRMQVINNNNNFRLFGYIRRSFILNTEVVSETKYSMGTADRTPSHASLINEAYDAFAIPMPGDEPLGIYENGNAVGYINSDASWAMAQKLMQSAGSGGYDLQLLPYCPLDNVGNERNQLQMKTQGDGSLVWGFDFSWIFPGTEGSGTEKVGVVFWMRKASFESVIDYTDSTDYSDPMTVKCVSQLTKCQLASGDYSSIFEFNKAKNLGISGFTIDCTYKPYAPYIRVAPIFNALYGSDFNDMRGLVCNNTNYSITRTTDAWDTYERNNLNYQNAFARGIKNLETQRGYQRGQEIAGIFAGAMQGAASGAMGAGFMSGGNPIAAAVGGVVGGVASAGAGLADLYVSEQLYKENKSYTTDMYNYNLQNIQAQPDTLATVGSNVINNKIYPILITYNCSAIETEAFKQKIIWNGMSVNIITNNVTEYIAAEGGTYIKGQIININLEGVAHEASELANEVAKGIILEVAT